MLFFLFLIIGIIFSVFISYELFDTWISRIAAFICFTLLFALLAFALFGLTNSLFSCFADIEYVETDNYNIVALKDNASVEGHTHFLGSSHINGEMSYVFMIQNEDNSYTMQTINAKNATIHYTKDKPYIIEKTPYFSNDFVKFLVSKYTMVDMHYDIYIPEGSIEYSYNIDLE